MGSRTETDNLKSWRTGNISASTRLESHPGSRHYFVAPGHARHFEFRFLLGEYWILDGASNVQQVKHSIYAEPIIYDEERLHSLLQGSIEPRAPPVPAQCMSRFLHYNAITLTYVSLDRLEKHEYPWLSSLLSADMFPVLRDFKLSVSVLDLVETDILFKICSRLERLNLDKADLTRPKRPGAVLWYMYLFSRLRSLHVSTPSDHNEAITWEELVNNFFTLVPQLTSLEWGLRIGYVTNSPEVVRATVAASIRQLENAAWPHLQSIHIDGVLSREILDDELAQVLDHCPSLIQLRLPCSRFGDRCLCPCVGIS